MTEASIQIPEVPLAIYNAPQSSTRSFKMTTNGTSSIETRLFINNEV
jgi:hypothetical protein